MTALHPSDIDRFAKLLSLLGSDQIEREFLVQMAAQRTRPTEKQADWLDGLFDRAMRAGRR